MLQYAHDRKRELFSMQGTTSTSRITFGLYEVDLQTGELWRSGYRVKLQSQPFKVLTILLERAGEVVTREELQTRLWGSNTTVDFDHSLATAINKIREALRDSAENPRFVETLARRGYRFIAPVTQPPIDIQPEEPSVTAEIAAGAEVRRLRSAEEARKTDPGTSSLPIWAAEVPASKPFANPGSETSSPKLPLSAANVSRWNIRRYAWALGLLLAAGGALCGYLLGIRSSATTPPHMVQLTHSGHLAVDISATENLMAGVTDGYRLFVPVLDGGQAGIATVPIAGGPLSNLSLPDEVASPMLGDISPDGSRLLLRNHLSPESEQPLWVVPTSGGSALRVDGALAHDATWMPDGKGILFAAGNELYLTRAANSSPQLFASLPGRAFWLRWNPSGNLLRFTIIDPIAHTESLWQLSAADRTPKQILRSFMGLPMECCGVWTADGRSFVFQSGRGGNTDLWKLSGDRTASPTRLTDGPLQFESPLAARSGNTLFFLGVDSRAQLERLTANGELVPERGFLASASRVEFSRDRKWVAWTDSDGRLWRSAADGSERLQLTPDTLDVFLARWAPDASRLAFMAREPGNAWKIYLVAADGGDIQPLLRETRNAADPSWSPDGQMLVFGRINDPLGKENAARTLHILDLRSSQVEQVPGSEGLFSPRWSPDGRYIAALSLDQRQVRLFNLATREWSSLSVQSGADPVWSSDSHYLYLHEPLNRDQPIVRVAVPEGTVQQLIRLSDSPQGDAVSYIFGGLTEDNEPLIVERTFTGNMYSLQLN